MLPASKVLTQSRRARVEALIAGERDAAVLAELAEGKLRPKIPALTAALTGHFGAHHAVAARRILAHLDYPTVQKITDAQMRQIPLQPHDWHSDWNRTRSTRRHPPDLLPGAPTTT